MMENPTPEHRVGPGTAAQGALPGSGLAHLAPGPCGEAAGLPFGSSLEPALGRACGGRLSPVNWFRTDWQRGGAVTGYATWRDESGAARPVVVKLPVPPVERLWLRRLQAATDVVPALHADGVSLNGYDMAWVVMERLEHGPLGSAWAGREFDLVLEAACRFYQAAAGFGGGWAPPERDWEQVLDSARRAVAAGGVPDAPRWSRALRHAQRHVRNWSAQWARRPLDQWCHGDLHLGNAMTRVAAPGGPAVLFDFALTRRGHWLEDALYFEHLYWGRHQRLGDRNLCRQMARRRKRLGLPLEPDWADLARTRRALLAVAAPAAQSAAADRTHLGGALAILEREVGS